MSSFEGKSSGAQGRRNLLACRSVLCRRVANSDEVGCAWENFKGAALEGGGQLVAEVDRLCDEIGREAGAIQHLLGEIV